MKRAKILILKETRILPTKETIFYEKFNSIVETSQKQNISQQYKIYEHIYKQKN